MALLALAPVATPQDAMPIGDAGPQPLSSHLDYTRPENRDWPIRCKDGDINFHADKSLGDLFGDDWPAAPVAAKTERARTLRTVAPRWPKGLGQSGSVVVTAALIDAAGDPIDAFALCATTPAIAKPVVRAAMSSRYSAATFDNVPMTSVVVRVWRFNIRDVPAPVARQP